MTDFISKVENQTAWFILNRPDEMNALNHEIVEGMDKFLSEAEGDDNIKCLVISGKGRAFCAGADLKSTTGADPLPPGDPDFYDRIWEVFGRLRNFPKPVIASLNGYTMAGGLEIAMCCDLVVPRVIPLNVAKYLLFTGKTLSAQEMKDYGFVNEVTPHDALEETTQALADHISAKSPLALRRMKVVAQATQGQTRDDALRNEQLIFRQHLRSADMVEGLAAFAEKRPPVFQGR